MFKEASTLKDKREKAIKYLGDKWVLSKANQIKKKPKDSVIGVLGK